MTATVGMNRDIDDLIDALKPLVEIVDAFDANGLDDEARKFWGKNDENVCNVDTETCELFTGRGGKRLLTLAQALRARDVVRRFKVSK